MLLYRKSYATVKFSIIFFRGNTFAQTNIKSSRKKGKVNGNR